MLSSLLQDIRYAARRLAASPGFTAAAIVTIALGVGANAAIFGVAKSVLLDALPYAEADRLVRIYGGLRDDARQRGPLTAGAVTDIAARQQSFASMAAFASFVGDAVYGGEDGPRVAKVAWVEPSLFETLGVAAAQGRMLRAEDAMSGFVPLERRSARRRHGDVRRDFACGVAAAVLRRSRSRRPRGRSSRDCPARSSACCRESFIGPAGEADFYFAFDIAPVAAHAIAGRRSGWLGFVGRLKPGVSEAAAASEVATIWAQLKRELSGRNHSGARDRADARRSRRRHAHAARGVARERRARVARRVCEFGRRAAVARALAAPRVRRARRARRGALADRAASPVRERAAWLGGWNRRTAAGNACADGVARASPASSLPSHAELSLDGGAILAGSVGRARWPASHSARRPRSRSRQPTRKRRCARRRAARARLAARVRCEACSLRASSRFASACWRAPACSAQLVGDEQRAARLCARRRVDRDGSFAAARLCGAASAGRVL